MITLLIVFVSTLVILLGVILVKCRSDLHGVQALPDHPPECHRCDNPLTCSGWKENTCPIVIHAKM